MGQFVTHNRTFKVFSLLLLACYTISCPFFTQLNVQSADLSNIIHHLQNSTNSTYKKSTIANSAQSESFRILKLVAGINSIQLDCDETTQETIIVKLLTPHLLLTTPTPATPATQKDRLSSHTSLYISVIAPPTPPPPKQSIV